MDFDKNIVDKAQLNKTDIARIFGVSRTTVHNWYRGTSVHPLLYDKAVALFGQLHAAVDRGALPTDLSHDVEERTAELQNILSPES